MKKRVIDLDQPITRLDLRLEYKSDTSVYPNVDREQTGPNVRDGKETLRSYVSWLEEKILAERNAQRLMDRANIESEAISRFNKDMEELGWR